MIPNRLTETAPSENDSAGHGDAEVDFRSRIRLTPVRIVLVVGLWVATSLPAYILHSVFGPHPPAARSAVPISAASTHQMTQALDVFVGQGTLIAAVLLYFGIARRGNAFERRLRRGEVFTGVINLHIWVIVGACLLIPYSGHDVEPFRLGTSLLKEVLYTGIWCAMAFHLCEGRLFIPIVGFYLANSLYHASEYFVPSETEHLYGLMCITTGVNLAWQLGTLFRYGGGFDLFPTGLFPAMKRCARVFLPVAFCVWIISGKVWHFFQPLMPEPEKLPQGLTLLWWGDFLLIAYLTPLALMLWEPGQAFERRSRNLVVVLSVGYFVLAFGEALVDIPWVLLSVSQVIRPGSMDILSGPSDTLRLLILTFWHVFVPLCLLRWWVRNRFARPLLVAVLAYGIHALPYGPIVAFSDVHAMASVMTEAVAALIVLVALFRRLPQFSEGSQKEVITPYSFPGKRRG